MSNVNKQDMSNTCELRYEEYWMKANHERTMPQKDWMEWYNNHCGKCQYMCEVCMYGEE